MKKLFQTHKALADTCLIGALLLLAAVLYFAFSAGRDAGAWAVVRVNGEEVARYSLAQSGTYPLNGGTNLLVIDGGEAWLTDADCPDKLCVRQGHIKYNGQCITCLPNKLTVTLEGGEDDGIDLVS
jgi:hypothetical protein